MSNFSVADAREAITVLEQRLDEIGAAPSIDTLHAFGLIHQLGIDMRNGYTTKKAETLANMSDRIRAAQASNNPAKVAEGFLIEAFVIGWIGVDKLGK